MDLRPGTIVGPYRIRSKITDGGMSTLYAAELRPKYRRQGSQRRVVLKLANPDREAFLKEEADFLIRFSHPGIVRIYPLPTRGGDDYVAFAQTPEGRQPYIALEHAGGGSLEDHMARVGPLPVPEAVSIAAQVARALHHAHTCGVVNRDVKPGNVLFHRRPNILRPGRGKVVLCDFGIAQDVDRPHAGESRVGTIAYMSPEQLQRLSQDWVRIGPQSDIFSLGVVLYEMLTGRTPFEGDVARIVDPASIPAPPSSLRSGIPPFLDRVVLQALEKDPYLRFQTAANMAEALDHVPRLFNWRFVAGWTIRVTVLLLVMMLAWQAGTVIRDSNSVSDFTMTPVIETVPVTAAPTTPLATEVPPTPSATSSPSPTIEPTVTLQLQPTSTSIPLYPTSSRTSRP